MIYPSRARVPLRSLNFHNFKSEDSEFLSWTKENVQRKRTLLAFKGAEVEGGLDYFERNDRPEDAGSGIFDLSL